MLSGHMGCTCCTAQGLCFIKGLQGISGTADLPRKSEEQSRAVLKIHPLNLPHPALSSRHFMPGAVAFSRKAAMGAKKKIQCGKELWFGDFRWGPLCMVRRAPGPGRGWIFGAAVRRCGAVRACARSGRAQPGSTRCRLRLRATELARQRGKGRSLDWGGAGGELPARQAALGLWRAAARALTTSLLLTPYAAALALLPVAPRGAAAILRPRAAAGHHHGSHHGAAARACNGRRPGDPTIADRLDGG